MWPPISSDLATAASVTHRFPASSISSSTRHRGELPAEPLARSLPGRRERDALGAVLVAGQLLELSQFLDSAGGLERHAGSLLGCDSMRARARMTTHMATIDDILGAPGRDAASRVTLRQDLPGDYAFPVTNEALAHGVGSLLAERTVDLRTQPVVLELQQGRQVVQDDCRAAYPDPAFQRMLAAYGGLAAQIVTPILYDGRLRAVVSLAPARAAASLDV